MKILVVTNLYPPFHLGGYELGCRDIVEDLRARGHLTHVLTSGFGVGSGTVTETGIDRTLCFSSSTGAPQPDKWKECHKLCQVMAGFSPDVVLFSNQAGLCMWLPLVARWHGCPAVFFLSDTTFVSWRVGAWLAGPAGKNALIRVLLGKTFLVRGKSVVENQACHFASGFLRRVAEQNGISIAGRESLVAHWGIDQSQFITRPRPHRPPRRLLYVGRLSPQKGVHTAIAAFDLLAREPGYEDVTFTIAGGGPDLEYAKKMRELTSRLKLTGRVNFTGELTRAELRGIYAEHDLLVFPSEWDEPFAITPLEAIASGLAVVGTTTGGSGELFVNRDTAMTFQAGDAADCARAIRELCADQGLFEFITKNAQRIVKERHTLDAMVDVIEAGLQKTVSLHRP